MFMYGCGQCVCLSVCGMQAELKGDISSLATTNVTASKVAVKGKRWTKDEDAVLRLHYPRSPAFNYYHRSTADSCVL